MKIDVVYYDGNENTLASYVGQGEDAEQIIPEVHSDIMSQGADACDIIAIIWYDSGLTHVLDAGEQDELLENDRRNKGG